MSRKNQIQKEDILALTNDGYDIFNQYLGEHYPGGNIKKRQLILSPFREEKNPSFNIYQNKDGLWLTKDFGDSRYDFDCFSFYQYEKQLPDFIATLKAINDDFNLGLVEEEVEFSGTIKKRKFWKTKELTFWSQYGITKDILDLFKVYALESFEFMSSKETKISINSSPNNPIFAYQIEKENNKIYQPFPKEKKYKFRWIGRKPKDFIFGWDQLPDRGESVFITGGEKDVMSLYAHGYPAICLNSETANLPPELLEKLGERFEKVIVLYDIDETGLTAAKKLSTAFGLPILSLPSTLQTQAQGKDISDYFKVCLSPVNEGEFSLEKFRELIEKLPKPIPPQEIIKLSHSQIGLDIWLFEIKRRIVKGVEVEKKLVFKGMYRDGIIKLLASNGYYKKYQHDNSYVLVYEKDNIIEEVEPQQIRDFLDPYVRAIDEPIEVFYDGLSVEVSPSLLIETFLRQSHLYINKNFLEHLPNHTKPILKDDTINCFLPYQDSIISINGKDRKNISYKDLGEKCVWKKQIIDREFTYLKNFEEGHFYAFIGNVCGGELSRMRSFFSAIGYLIHNYNYPSKGQAVICYDEQITDLSSPQGGTGKGLFAQGIRAIRDTVKIDGKKFKEENRFCFQDISLSTQVVWIDDVKPDLSFDRFNSLLTDGWNIEQKYKAAIYIAAKDSPKLLILSNSILEGEGTTRKRRQFILEFGNYYSSKIKTGIEEPIIEEHGCTFFSQDWKEIDWNLFDSFIVYCVELYMKEGLIPFPLKNVEENRIRQVLGEDFYDWETEKAFKLNEEYETKQLYEEYTNIYHGKDDRFKQRSFTNMLKKYARIKNWKMKCYASHGVSKFMFESGN